MSTIPPPSPDRWVSQTSRVVSRPEDLSLAALMLGLKRDLQHLQELMSSDRRIDTYRASLDYDAVYTSFLPLIEKCGFNGKEIREELQSGKSEKLDLVEKKIKKAAQKAFPFLSTKKTISWVTGTRSPTLIGMSRVAGIISKMPALVPTGQLIERGFVPLTGELFIGIREENSVNRRYLSGTNIDYFGTCLRYALDKKMVINPQYELDYILSYNPNRLSSIPYRLDIAFSRLIQLQKGEGGERRVQRAFIHIRDQILPKLRPLPTGWETAARLIGEERDDFDLRKISGVTNAPRGTIVGLEGKKLAMIKLYNSEEKAYLCIFSKKGPSQWAKEEDLHFYDPESVNMAALTKPELPEIQLRALLEKIAERDEQLEWVQKTLQRMGRDQPLQLSEMEKNFLKDTYPIVFGMTSQKFKKAPVMSGIRGEVGVEMKELGEEIDVVFTKAKRVSLMRDWLTQHHLESVAVMSFSAAWFIRAVQVSSESGVEQLLRQSSGQKGRKIVLQRRKKKGSKGKQPPF